MIGTVIMMHGDDDGMVVPPRIAPTHIVILPITSETGDAGRGAGTLRIRLAVELRSR